MIAKFRCTEITKTLDGIRISLAPVTGGCPENDKFFKLTPYGKLEIGTINPTAEAMFEPGKEYFVDITEAGVKR